MRPKKRLLVSKSEREDTLKNTSRKIHVSRSINPDELQLETSDSNLEYNSSSYGKLSPVRENNQCEAFPRKDTLGDIVPYSILGTVTQYMAAGPPPPSSRSTIPTPSRSSPNKVQIIQPATKSNVDHIQEVRRLARKETIERQKKSEIKEQAIRHAKLKGLLAHEVLMHDRQQRALELHQQWEKEWSSFKKTMLLVSGKEHVNDLVVSRGPDFREKSEEYSILGQAIPHHEKHGSEYWMMSLRGMGTRYVAVGNIFSGLFCPVKEVPNLENEIIRLPQPIRESDRPTWRESPVLQRTQKRLARNLNKIRPCVISTEDANHLVIKGEPLLEWAYVSIEERALKSTVEEEESLSSPIPAETPSGPQLEIDCKESKEDISVAPGKIVFRNHVNEVQSHIITVNNTGTTVLYFKFQSDVLVPAENEIELFRCVNETGVLLPGQMQQVAFSFNSDMPGSWSQNWMITTNPSIEPQVVSLCGLSQATDLKIGSRMGRLVELEQKSADAELMKVLDNLLENVLPAPQLESKEDVLTQRRAAFDKANRSLGVFYHHELDTVMDDIASRLYTELSRFSPASAIDASLPSIIQLKRDITSLKNGTHLHPEDRAPTVCSDLISDGGFNEEDSYLFTEKTRFAAIAKTLDEDLQAAVQIMLRRPEEMSLVWNASKQLVVNIVDNILDVLDVSHEEGSQTHNDEDEGPLHRIMMLVKESTDAYIESIDIVETPLTSWDIECHLLSLEGNLKNQRVVAHVNMNNITDLSATEESLKSLRIRRIGTLVDTLCASGSTMISLFGLGGENESFSQVVEELASSLGREVIFISDFDSEETRELVECPKSELDEQEVDPGEVPIYVMENISLVEKLSVLEEFGDVFINDNLDTSFDFPFSHVGPHLTQDSRIVTEIGTCRHTVIMGGSFDQLDILKGFIKNNQCNRVFLTGSFGEEFQQALKGFGDRFITGENTPDPFFIPETDFADLEAVGKEVEDIRNTFDQARQHGIHMVFGDQVEKWKELLEQSSSILVLDGFPDNQQLNILLLQVLGRLSIPVYIADATLIGTAEYMVGDEYEMPDEEEPICDIHRLQSIPAKKRIQSEVSKIIHPN